MTSALVAFCGTLAVWPACKTKSSRWLLALMAAFAAFCSFAASQLYSVSLLWAVFSTVLSALLALAAVIDHQTGRIPDVVPAVLALTGAAMLFLTGAQWLPFVVTSAAIVALLVTVRARNRPIPIGEGDLLLIAAAGMWLGPIHLAWAILVSTAAHLVGLLVQRFAGGPSPTLAPFAPAMFFGIFCVWALSR